MNAFDCLEDGINELELKIIESLKYSEDPDLNKYACDNLTLYIELIDSERYLKPKEIYFHKQTKNSAPCALLKF